MPSLSEMGAGSPAPLGPAAGQDAGDWPGFGVMAVGAVIAAAMSWAIGAQDVSNCFGTAVGSKALTVMQAVLIAAVCEFVGSLTGGDVAATLATGILDMGALEAMGPAGVALYMRCMLATMIGAVAWLIIATIYSLPVSTTHSLVGALIGVSLLATGSAKWATLGGVLSSWVTSPVMGCLISYLMYIRIHRLLQQAQSPQAAIRAALPWYYAFTVAAMALFLALIGPKAYRLTYSQAAVTAALVFGAVFMAVRRPSAAMHAAARALAVPATPKDHHRAPLGDSVLQDGALSASASATAASSLGGGGMVGSSVRGRKRGSQSTSSSEQDDSSVEGRRGLSGSDAGDSSDGSGKSQGHSAGNGAARSAGGVIGAASPTGGDAAGASRQHGGAGAGSGAGAAAGAQGDEALSATADSPPALGMLGAAFGRALESKRDGGKDVGRSFHRGVVDGVMDGSSDGSALVIGADSIDLTDDDGGIVNGAASAGAGGDIEAGWGVGGAKRAAEVAEAESEFVRLLVLTSCVLSFSHGSQDVSNAAAPYAAVVAVAASKQLGAASSTPTWVLAAGGVGIVIGLATYGYKVMATVGTGITKLTYAKGFAAQLATALTALTATLLGLTVSTTHVMIGAIAGVALADGPDKLNLDMLKKIAASWVITLPASAALAAVGYGILSTAGLPTVP